MIILMMIRPDPKDWHAHELLRDPTTANPLNWLSHTHRWCCKASSHLDHDRDVNDDHDDDDCEEEDHDDDDGNDDGDGDVNDDATDNW